MKPYVGVEAKPHSFLTSALRRGESLASCTGHFICRERNLIAGVNFLEKRKIPCPCWKFDHDSLVV
jgi:hypothetical protein